MNPVFFSFSNRYSFLSRFRQQQQVERAFLVLDTAAFLSSPALYLTWGGEPSKDAPSNSGGDEAAEEEDAEEEEEDVERNMIDAEEEEVETVCP